MARAVPPEVVVDLNDAGGLVIQTGSIFFHAALEEMPQAFKTKLERALEPFKRQHATRLLLAQVAALINHQLQRWFETGALYWRTTTGWQWDEARL